MLCVALLHSFSAHAQRDGCAPRWFKLQFSLRGLLAAMALTAVGTKLAADKYFASKSDHATKELPSAAKKGDVDKVKELLRWNPRVNEGSALTDAAENGHAEIVELLIQRGAHVLKRSTISDAAFNNHWKVLTQLLKNPYHGEFPQGDLSSAFIMAVSADQVEAVEALLEAGAPLEEERLYPQAFIGHGFEIDRALVRAGANPKHIQGHNIYMDYQKKGLNVVKDYEKLGALAEGFELQFEHLMNLATEGRNEDLLGYLLTKPLSQSAADKALARLVQNDSIKFFEAAKKAGANPNVSVPELISSGPSTLIEVALLRGNEAAAKELIRLGADVNGSKGSPLFTAISLARDYPDRKGDERPMIFLLEAGARVNSEMLQRAPASVVPRLKEALERQRNQ